MEAEQSLRALAINCTLKTGSAESSTELLLTQVLDELQKNGVEGSIVRVVNLNIKPGVTSDEGDDDWPEVRERILDSDIIVLGTPIWLGQPSSVVKRVLERMDGFLSEADDQGRYPSYGKVALVAVVGNEDGAHHVSAEPIEASHDCFAARRGYGVLLATGMSTIRCIQLLDRAFEKSGAEVDLRTPCRHAEWGDYGPTQFPTTFTWSSLRRSFE